MAQSVISRIPFSQRIPHKPASVHRRHFVHHCSKGVDEAADEKSLPKRIAETAGVSMGPISLSFSDDFQNPPLPYNDAEDVSEIAEDPESSDYGKRIHSLTTEEWRELYEKDGTVDLWVEEEYNAGSRLKGGRDVHLGKGYGVGTGEGASRGSVPLHHVVIHNRYTNSVFEVDVPEDRYVLWEAEDHGMKLPFACRMGCCTACAVKVISGEMHQPQALGISRKLKEQGYALMCVGYPKTDLVLETVDEDEVYDLQFGRHFAENATNKNGNLIERDDFALELAEMDE